MRKKLRYVLSRQEVNDGLKVLVILSIEDEDGVRQAKKGRRVSPFK
jgi:hypothetical protein